MLRHFGPVSPFGTPWGHQKIFRRLLGETERALVKHGLMRFILPTTNRTVSTNSGKGQTQLSMAFRH